jgi:hypothetical protein
VRAFAFDSSLVVKTIPSICWAYLLKLSGITPASAARPYPARSLKFMPRWSRPLDAVLAPPFGLRHEFIFPSNLSFSSFNTFPYAVLFTT